MTALAEGRLENNLVLFGNVGGPQFSTDVVVVRSGHERRNTNWSRSRGRWEMGERTVDTALGLHDDICPVCWNAVAKPGCEYVTEKM